MLKTCVLGAGAFGTSLAKHLADKGYPTALWARREDLATAIETDRCNSRYLPDAPLPDTLSATNDMEKALEGAKLVLFVVPSHATRDVAQTAKPLLQSEALVCCATKGIHSWR